MNDSEISFDIEFNSRESTIQSAFFQIVYCDESIARGMQVPSRKHSFVLAPSAILTDLLQDRKLFPFSGVDTSIIPG